MERNNNQESTIISNTNNLGTGCQENFYSYSENKTITRNSDGSILVGLI